ncbi:hypothetical protein [Paenibacillus sp. NEAU-GSW1]|uniref:hypothetical protein n=1 Tax=Paenibacillus sp. NEAU-GSW1 TaxID=2682486 RepID=UPI00156393A6|nr:hypothetical protein [Paenibacillus sp. NEAU-GSW1]
MRLCDQIALWDSVILENLRPNWFSDEITLRDSAISSIVRLYGQITLRGSAIFSDARQQQVAAMDKRGKDC